MRKPALYIGRDLKKPTLYKRTSHEKTYSMQKRTGHEKIYFIHGTSHEKTYSMHGDES